MRPLRAYCCLLLCIGYISLVACKDENKDGGTKGLTAHTININNCLAVPVEQPAHDGDPVTWVPDVNYQITFLATSTPIGPKFPVATNPFIVRAGSTVPQFLHGPSDCSPKPNGCVYKYTITRVVNNVPTPPPCADPGIRIVPLNTVLGGN